MAEPKPLSPLLATSPRAISKVALIWAMYQEAAEREWDTLTGKKVSRSAPKKKPRQLRGNQE
jgi:hypothetical protein